MAHHSCLSLSYLLGFGRMEKEIQKKNLAQREKTRVGVAKEGYEMGQNSSRGTGKELFREIRKSGKVDNFYGYNCLNNEIAEVVNEAQKEEKKS